MDKNKKPKKGSQKSVFISIEADAILRQAMEETQLSYSELVSASVEHLGSQLKKIAMERGKKQMDRKDKIKDAVKRTFSIGQEVKTSEIIEAVQKHYPEVPVGSILPADFSDNHSNDDPFSGRYFIFSRVGHGKYIIL